MTSPSNLYLYHQLYTIRRFEETVLGEFAKGVFSGTTHTYLGQEANAVGILSQLQEEDIVFSNHRCHGHFLAYGGDPRALFAEMMGKPSGVCHGLGGSQHLHYMNFYSNGILGGTVPIAVGSALAEKFKGSAAVTVIFMGDGALGEGIVYEAFNMAALWKTPILFVIENNHIAQTTPTAAAMSGTIRSRLEAFNIFVKELDSSDVRTIHSESAPLLQKVRQNQEPCALILNTERFGPHSKGDDTRSPEYIEYLKQTRDPLLIQASRLAELEVKLVEQEVDAMIHIALQQATEDPYEMP